MIDLRLRDNVRGYRISTVWLFGVRHDGGDYETMIFKSPDGHQTDWSELYAVRYMTREEAIAGHASVVAAVTDGILPEEGSE